MGTKNYRVLVVYLENWPLWWEKILLTNGPKLVMLHQEDLFSRCFLIFVTLLIPLDQRWNFRAEIYFRSYLIQTFVQQPFNWYPCFCSVSLWSIFSHCKHFSHCFFLTAPQIKSRHLSSVYMNFLNWSHLTSLTLLVFFLPLLSHTEFVFFLKHACFVLPKGLCVWSSLCLDILPTMHLHMVKSEIIVWAKKWI